MNKSVYFIILNYNTAEDTKKCVKSIRGLETHGYDIKIVIIDNNSPDNSYEELMRCYSDECGIKIIKTDKNVGFSKANNIGYGIALEDGTTEFCVVCNSDIIFGQRDFIAGIVREYSDSHFHVLGPDVWCEAMKNRWCKGHQSPWYNFETKEAYVRMHLQYNKMLLRRIEKKKTAYIANAYIRFKRCAWLAYRKLLTEVLMKDYRVQRHENVALHGSCIIISSRFMECEKLLFYPEVLFYGEELLLYLRVKRKDYVAVYNPRLQVQHMQGRATDTLGAGEDKEKFVYENLCIGDITYLKEMKRYNQ